MLARITSSTIITVVPEPHASACAVPGHRASHKFEGPRGLKPAARGVAGFVKQTSNGQTLSLKALIDGFYQFSQGALLIAWDYRQRS